MAISQASLLGVPLEIRREILLHLLDARGHFAKVHCCQCHLSGSDDTLLRWTRHKTAPYKAPDGIQTLANVSRVCWQLCSEVGEILYTVPNYQFCLGQNDYQFDINGPGVECATRYPDGYTKAHEKQKLAALQAILQRPHHVTLHVGVPYLPRYESEAMLGFEICEMKDNMDFLIRCLSDSPNIQTLHVDFIFKLSEDVFCGNGFRTPIEPEPDAEARDVLVTLLRALEQLPDCVRLTLEITFWSHYSAAQKHDFMPGGAEEAYIHDLTTGPREQIFKRRAPLDLSHFLQFRNRVLEEEDNLIDAYDRHYIAFLDGRSDAHHRVRERTIPLIERAWLAHSVGSLEELESIKNEMQRCWDEHYVEISTLPVTYHTESGDYYEKQENEVEKLEVPG